tara:strand:- start:1721 stop:2020 length:300 start_codon:yes stop_codon:yes gene_type:complete
MSIEAVAWSEKLDSDSLIIYRLQAKIKGKREMNRLYKELDGWNQCGEGYDRNQEKTILLLMREFKDRRSWVKFAKTLSFPVEEVSKSGKRKVINARRKK